MIKELIEDTHPIETVSVLYKTGTEHLFVVGQNNVTPDDSLPLNPSTSNTAFERVLAEGKNPLIAFLLQNYNKETLASDLSTNAYKPSDMYQRFFSIENPPYSIVIAQDHIGLQIFYAREIHSESKLPKPSNFRGHVAINQYVKNQCGGYTIGMPYISGHFCQFLPNIREQVGAHGVVLLDKYGNERVAVYQAPDLIDSLYRLNVIPLAANGHVILLD